MIASENRKSLLIGGSGIILQTVGWIAINSTKDPGTAALYRTVLLVGTVLLIFGLAFYAKAKGRHPAWGLMGLLSLIGIIVLGCLKDLAPEGRTPPPLPPQSSDHTPGEQT